MRVAGLLREQQYQETRARLQEQLDALGPAAAPPPPLYAFNTPPAAPPPPPPPAPPAVALLPAWQPAADASGIPAGAPEPGYAAPPAYPPPPPGYPPPPPLPTWQPPPPGQRHTRVVAALVGAGLILATVAAAAVVGRPSKPPAASAAATPASTPTATPVPTGTPDPAATLASLRNSQPDAGQPLVTPEQAKQLVQAFWTVREQGLSHSNPDTIHAIEDAAAGEYDAIGCTYGCPPPSPRPLKAVQVMVPLQKSYPAAFMAQVLTTEYHSSDALVEIMVYTRKSASVPWFLSFDTEYSGLNTLHEFPAGPDTFDQPPAPSKAVDYSALPSQLAAYWQYWKTNGVAPPGTHFEPGAFTSEQGLGTYQAWVQYRAQGIAEHTTYTAGTPQDGAWSFAVNVEDGKGQIEEGDVLTCATVRFHSVSTPIAPARTVVQDTGGEPYGNLLRPGEYSSVTVTGLHESCMLTRPGLPGIAVEGLAGEQTRVVGVPFSGSGVSA